LAQHEALVQDVSLALVLDFDSAMLVVADSRSALDVKPPFPLGTSTHFTEEELSAAVAEAPFA